MQKKYSNNAMLRWMLVVLASFIGLLPMICNDAPIVMRFHDQLYFPILFDYTEYDFGGKTLARPNYRSQDFIKKFHKTDFAVWPPVPYHFNTADETLAIAPSPPDQKHLLGTDGSGYDLFVLLLYALRQDILVAIAIVLMAATLGGILGCLQGYIGGYPDLLIQRIIEVWGSLPEVILLLFLMEQGCSLGTFIFWFALFQMVRYVSIVRVAVFRLRHMQYVLAARVMGVGAWTIFRHHVLPDTLSLIYAQMPFQAASALGILSALTILQGPITETPSIGWMIYQGRLYLCAPWIIISAMFILLLFILCIVFFAHRLQKATKEHWRY